MGNCNIFSCIRYQPAIISGCRIRNYHLISKVRMNVENTSRGSYPFTTCYVIYDKRKMTAELSIRLLRM